MNRRLLVGAVSTLCLILGLSGCSKSADQQAADDSGAAGSPASSSSSSKASAPKAPPPLVVPADTALVVVLDQTIGSKTSSSGQTFTATVHTPVDVDGKVAIPKGAGATGIVKEAKAAGRFKGAAVLALTLTSVTVDGVEYSVKTSAPTVQSTGKGKRTAAMVGGGAGGGALIGGLAGGGKGALIGGLVGAAAGTGGAAFTGNRDITLPAETALTFKILDPVEIKQR